jgi:hypothetical protein
MPALCPLDSGKRRPPWPAAQPAEPADAMTQAEGPALPGLLPELFEPKYWSQELGWEGPEACGHLFSSAQGLLLHTQKGTETSTEAKWGNWCQISLPHSM